MALRYHVELKELKNNTIFLWGFVAFQPSELARIDAPRATPSRGSSECERQIFAAEKCQRFCLAPNIQCPSISYSHTTNRLERMSSTASVLLSPKYINATATITGALRK